MNSSLIEVSQKKDNAGRRKIRIVLHEIHSNTDSYNQNGITWLEPYVSNNLPSAEGIPLCCQFLDEDMDVPYGHGEITTKDGQLIFNDSIVVGYIQQASVETIEVNGRVINAVVGEGFIYSNRYPLFVEWMEEKISRGENVESSVEIAGKDENNNHIVYEGGWKEKGRVPKEFSYIGHAILSIPPADDNAIILELNQKFKEDETMKDTVVELNNKIDAQRKEINQLESDVKAKESEVNELNEKITTKETELNSTIEQLKEVNAKLTDKDKELEDEKKKKKDLEAEVNELRAFKQEVENKKLVTELNSKLSSYTDEEKSVVKEKVELFSKEPKKELMSEIISEINSAIAQKIVAERSKQVQTEINSKAADIYSDVYEVNSDDEITTDDLY